MENCVELLDLKKTYKKFSLGSLSLNLPKGYILGLIGPNGAGKTTTIKILMDMIKADSGTVKIFGLDHEKHIKEIKNRVGYVGEDQHFYGDKTVSWTGRFAADLYHNWDLNRFESLLTHFQLSRTKKTQELSKGMKVKLSLALAMAHNPELYILDEPTAGLDPVIRREVLELLRNESKEKDKSVIISSHITDDIARIADVIVFLIEGKIVMHEEKDELLARWKRIHFQDNALTPEITEKFMNRRAQMFGNSGITDDYPALKPSLTAGIAQETVKIENVNLDDILIAFVKGDQ